MTISTKTIAITVTYNADTEILLQQFNSLASQCRVIIVDNGSSNDAFSKLKNISKNKDYIKLISLDKNIGISNAQNIGIKYVLEEFPKANFVLLLDHDSIPSKNMVNVLEGEFKSLAASGMKPAAIGPLLYDPRDNNYLGFHVIQNGLWKKITQHENSKPIECHSLNSSGSLISLDVIKEVGLLEKDFFMDHGETEWCFRAISKGYKIFGSAGVIMNHLMGDEVCEYWLFGRRRMPYRSPLRHYYLARNSILMQKRSYIPRTWKFWNIIKLFFTYVYFGFIAKESREHRNYIGRGIRDGLKGIAGKVSINNLI